MGSLEIVVDENDNPIGSKHRQDVHYEDIYRVAALWLTDEATGEILLAQRARTKRNDPGKWSAAASGTVEAGETYEANIIKEIEEEIGLENLDLKQGPKTYTDDGKHKFYCQWFTASVEKNKVNIVFQKEEVAQVKWVTKAALLDDLHNHPENYTPSTAENLRALGIL